MPTLKITGTEYTDALKTIENYLKNIYVKDGELEGLPYPEDMLNDILLDLGIEN